MPEERKNIFLIGNRVYEWVLDEGMMNGGAAAQFDHERAVLRVSARVPVELRAVVTAMAVSDACQRLWRPIPVVWPRWRHDPPAAEPPGRDPGGAPPTG